MSVTPGELGAYAIAIFILFITPGPVWVAIIARALSGSGRYALPLALGVAIGDVTWSMTAVLGMAWVVQSFAGAMAVLRWVAAGLFLIMGVLLIRHRGNGIPGRDSRLTRPGFRAGLAAGLAVVFANPKAILFYMGLLPGFFHLGRLGWPDMAAIALISATIPFLGNMTLALFVERARKLVTSPRAVRRTNVAAGLMMIGVGLVIPFL